MVNRKETNLDGVKAMARTLLYTDINKTAYSPIVVQHPFTNTGFTMVMRNGEPQCIDITADSNALHEWRKMVSEQIESSKSAFEIYMMTNKPYGMTFLKYAAHHLSKKDFSQILADAWIRSENPNDDPNLPQAKLLSLFQSAEPRHLMSQDELNTKGETYIDVAITVMIVAFVLVFSVNMVSLVALNQNVKTMADQIVDYATVNGTTDIGDYINDLKAKSGIDFSYTFSGTTYFSGQNVQLGDVIECKLTYRVRILGFGEAVFPITINASSSGISQVYWK